MSLPGSKENCSQKARKAAQEKLSCPSQILRALYLPLPPHSRAVFKSKAPSYALSGCILFMATEMALTMASPTFLQAWALTLQIRHSLSLPPTLPVPP